jgi:hyaluronate lyase
MPVTVAARTVRALLLGTGFDPAAEPFRSRLAELGTLAGQYRATMAPAPGSLWPDLDYADPDPNTDQSSYGYSSRMSTGFARLRTMAEAYRQPGTGLTGDAALRDAVRTGLEHLYAEIYHENQPRFGNWYDWGIGAPQRLLDTLVLLDGQLPAGLRAGYLRAVDHFVPDSAVAHYTGVSTGANRVDLCRVLALRGVCGDHSPKVTLAADALSPVFPYVTSGDGLYRDGSFIQHTYVPYAGSYGAVLLGGLGLLFALLAGSPWEVTDPNREIVFDAVEGAWAPLLYNGLMMDAVSGRAPSRGVQAGDPRQFQQDDHARGHSVLAAILLLGQGAGAAHRARWRGLVKGWLERGVYHPAASNPTLAVSALARLSQVRADASVAPVPEPTGHRLFGAMDRAVHRRPTWAASLSMSSRRIAHYETGNGENLRGWHTGSGMLYWWGSTFGNGQYSDAFWPTVNPYRLPGITASAKPLPDAAGGDWGASRPDVNWVGGATDGEFAGVGQYVKNVSSTLLAKKSWYFLDDAVVCLGAGIRCRDGHRVESVVDNRNLGPQGLHQFQVDGAVMPREYPWSATLTGVRWAQLAGFGGYVFPGGATVRALREERTGRWRDINRGGSTTPLSRRYLTLWHDHGVDPDDAGYASVLLPGASAEQTAARAADGGWLTVLANTDDRQGIAVPALGVTAVNFWFGGTAGPLTADQPCAVLVRERPDGTAVVCVADPMRMRTSLTVTWRRPVREVISAPDTLTSAATGSALVLRFGDLTGTAGGTQRVTVRLA